MSKTDRGTKRHCDACGNNFYDLGREPITCPSCGEAVVISKPEPARVKKAPVPAKAPDPPPEPVKAAPVAAADGDNDEDGSPVGADEKDAAAIAELATDDEEDIPPAENEADALLEREDEPEAEVEGMVRPPAKPADER